MPPYKIITIHPDYRRWWASYSKKWNNCTKCILASRALNHVLVRGTIPSDFVFVGEAPGKKENDLGYPFVGDSGLVLDKLLTQVKARLPDRVFTYSILNTVCCIPLLPEKYEIRSPSETEMATCLPHVQEYLSKTRPKGVILLGNSAEASVSGLKDFWKETPVLKVWHPSYILRNGGATERNPKYVQMRTQLEQWLELQFAAIHPTTTPAT